MVDPRKFDLGALVHNFVPEKERDGRKVATWLPVCSCGWRYRPAGRQHLTRDDARTVWRQEHRQTCG